MSDYVTKNDLDTLDKKLDKRFDDLTDIMRTFMQQVDERFNDVDTKLFRIEQRLEEHDRQLAELKEDQAKMFNVLDAIAKKQEIDDDERLMLQHQLDKLVLWAKQVADKVGVELTSL